MTQELRSELGFFNVDGRSMEIARHAQTSAQDTIVLLHEALGSVRYWKNFPQRLALATGCNVLTYSRAGHGDSQGPVEPRDDAHYMHHIRVVLPELLERFGIRQPILYGHSEGASLALLYAAESKDVQDVIAESPYLVASAEDGRLIARMNAEFTGSKLQERLAQYHREPEAVFRAWTSWAATLREGDSPLRIVLPQISCPVLVLQGADDPFGTTSHLQALQAALPDVHHEVLAGAGHLPHREKTEQVLGYVSQFLIGIRTAAGVHPSTSQPAHLEERP